MHGRLKVRTSAEEAERKRNEQKEKVKAYRAAMDRILAKRATCTDYDAEMMQLTAGVLQRNPDVATLWNIRRECLLQLKATNADNVQEVFDKELSLTRTCLEANPKSYCAWHHRCWILENTIEPNWQREVNICTEYLKKDERNFHVWDYRRHAVAHANITPEKELAFSTEKIQNNFSNYSSWHARSKLLPLLHPHESDKTRPINEEVLRDELELVLTAAFTDPNDSSAWFYQRWLLGNSEQELDLAAFKLTKTYALLAFSKPVDLHRCALSLDATTTFDTKKWHPIKETGIRHNDVWKLEDSFELNAESGLSFELSFTDENGTIHTMPITKCNDGLFGIKMPRFGYEFGKNVKELLMEQLASCKQLLEFEPESKYTLLAAALLMRAIDRKQYHAETLEFLEILKQCDSVRIGYYIDLANKWSIEDRLADWIVSLEDNKRMPLDLSNLNLVGVQYQPYFCVADKIDFRQNKFADGKRTDALKTFLENCHVNYEI